MLGRLCVFLSVSCCCLRNMRLKLNVGAAVTVLLFTGDPGLRLRPEGAAEAEAETLQQTDPCSRLPHSGIWPGKEKNYRNRTSIQSGGGTRLSQSPGLITETILSCKPDTWKCCCEICSIQPSHCHFHAPPDVVEMFCGGELWISHVQEVFEEAVPHHRLLVVHAQAQEIGQWSACCLLSVSLLLGTTRNKECMTVVWWFNTLKVVVCVVVGCLTSRWSRGSHSDIQSSVHVLIVWYNRLCIERWRQIIWNAPWWLATV